MTDCVKSTVTDFSMMRPLSIEDQVRAGGDHVRTLYLHPSNCRTRDGQTFGNYELEIEPRKIAMRQTPFTMYPVSCPGIYAGGCKNHFLRGIYPNPVFPCHS